MLNWHSMGIEIECIHTMPSTWQVNTQEGGLRYTDYKAIPSQYLKYAYCYVPVVGEFMQHQPQAYATLNAAAVSFTSLQLKYDPTIEVPVAIETKIYQPLEIISPILKNQITASTFIDLLKLFEKAGAEQNASTATQFHIDILSIDLLTLISSLDILDFKQAFLQKINSNMLQAISENQDAILDANFKNKKISELHMQDNANNQHALSLYLLQHIFEAKFIQFFLILNFKYRNIFLEICKDWENIPEWAKILPDFTNIEVKNRGLKNKKVAQANCYELQKKIQAQQSDLEIKSQKNILNYIHNILNLNYLPNLIAYNGAYELDLNLFFKNLTPKRKNQNEAACSALCQYSAQARFRSINLESFYKHQTLEVRHLSPSKRYDALIHLPTAHIENMMNFLQLLIKICKLLAAHTMYKYIEYGFFDNIQHTVFYILTQAENPEYADLTIKDLFEKPKDHHNWLPQHRQNIHQLLNFSDDHEFMNTFKFWHDLQNDEIFIFLNQQLQTFFED